jgi:hypothetical protein
MDQLTKDLVCWSVVPLMVSVLSECCPMWAAVFLW